MAPVDDRAPVHGATRPPPARGAPGGFAVEELKAKVVLVGAAGVGKTSLVRRYVLDAFGDRYRATLGGVVYRRTEDLALHDRRVRATLTLWDMRGGSALRALRDLYLHGAQGVLAVCDVTDEATVLAARPWILAASEAAGDVPVHILLNKADLGAAEEAVLAGRQEGILRGAPCYLTSARAGDNVATAFRDLARRIAERGLVAADGPLDDADLALALRCGTPRTVDEAARDRGMPVVLAEARLDRLRRRGYVRVASVDLDARGLPAVRYEVTGKAFAEIAALR